MLKFAFSVMLVAAIHQGLVGCVPPDSSPTLVQRLQIVGHAAIEVFKSVGEFGKNLTTIVGQEVRSEVLKVVKLGLARVSIMALASGADYHADEGPDGRIVSAAELRQFRVVAMSVEEVFGRLSTMEAANEVIVRTIRQAVNETGGQEVSREDLQLLFANLNRNFLADGGLREVYGRVRERNEGQVPFPGRKTAVSPADEALTKKKFAKSLLNFIFLQFAYSRLSTPRDRFLLARSTLELAKNPAKFERVQRVYEETLATQCELLDLDAKDFNGNQFYDSWFAKLKENFQKQLSLYEELKTVEKDVAQRKDWDRSIFDLPF